MAARPDSSATQGNAHQKTLRHRFYRDDLLYRADVKKKETVPTLVLFAGGGLADIGLQAAGFEPIAAVEKDPAIAACYRLNHGERVIEADCNAIDYKQFGRGWAKAIWCSPPCQQWSQARDKALPCREDGDVSDAIIRAIAEIEPQYFFLENVRGYLKSPAYAAIISWLFASGYGVDARVYNAANYGVPQNRLRLVVRAVRDRVVLPYPPTRNPQKVGWFEAIAPQLSECPQVELANWQKHKLFQQYPAFFLSEKTEKGRALVPRVGFRGDKLPLYTEQKTAPTLRALGHDRHWRQLDAIAWDEHHRLSSVQAVSPRCFAILQSVPKWYALPEDNCDATRIIGNGVPPLLAYAIATSLL
jgi:DNA (cytosine-5)-methyltransferase 1